MERLSIISNHLADSSDVCIVAYGRSPIHPSNGALKDFSFQSLASSTLTSVLSKYQIPSSHIQSLFMGCVNPSNLGQSPAKQIAHMANLPDSVSCFTVNKLCASGMKAVSLAYLSIKSGENDCIVAGGAESMSNYPFSLRLRTSIETKVEDSLNNDVLPDAVTKELPIVIADKVGRMLRISKDQLDNYAQLSCLRAAEAEKKGKFLNEIVPLTHPKTGKKIEKDFLRDFKGIKDYRPLYKDGTTSVGNTCGINDGASFLVLCSRKKAVTAGWRILGTIRSYSDAEQESEKFPLTPSLATYKLLSNLPYALSDIDLMEINEPFSSVVLGNSQILNYPISKININGGALALGHPVGSSGCRIIGTLLSSLITENKKLGIASICNGAGGGSAILIQSEPKN